MLPQTHADVNPNFRTPGTLQYSELLVEKTTYMWV